MEEEEKEEEEEEEMEEEETADHLQMNALAAEDVVIGLETVLQAAEVEAEEVEDTGAEAGPPEEDTAAHVEADQGQLHPEDHPVTAGPGHLLLEQTEINPSLLLTTRQAVLQAQRRRELDQLAQEKRMEMTRRALHAKTIKQSSVSPPLPRPSNSL